MMQTYRAYPPDGFETSADAEERRRRLIHILKSGGNDQRQLARKLARCRKEDRCRSGSCPSCLRLFRLVFLREGLQVLESRTSWVRASILPRAMAVPQGKLHHLSLARIVKTTRKRLERCLPDRTLVLGGVDISLNTTNNADPIWQGHLYLLIESKVTLAFKQRARNAFPAEPSAKRPYNFRQVGSHRKPLTYCIKPVFARRSQYVAKGKSHVTDQPLSSKQVAELALFLDQYAIGDRLILKGVRRAGRHLRVMP